MKLSLIALIALMPAGLFAGEKGPDNLEENKAMVLKMLDYRIAGLQAARECVSAAADKEALKTCRETMRKALEEMKEERKGERARRKGEKGAVKAEKQTEKAAKQEEKVPDNGQ